MSGKKLFISSGLIILMLLALAGWSVLFSQKPEILIKARLRYNQAVASHTDLSSGPCLGEIAPGWVLDIAHLPRQSIDNLPQNQCPDYLFGKASHFVEMTPAGEIITVK